jgi:integrase
MRPGELVIMRPDDIDRNNDVWTYIPEHHKTEHRGKTRIIYIGPQAQVILAPWLVKAKQFVFPSRDGRCYTSDSYRQVIHRACKRNDLKKWSPNQVRKAAATAYGQKTRPGLNPGISGS